MFKSISSGKANSSSNASKDTSSRISFSSCESPSERASTRAAPPIIPAAATPAVATSIPSNVFSEKSSDFKLNNETLESVDIPVSGSSIFAESTLFSSRLIFKFKVCSCFW